MASHIVAGTNLTRPIAISRVRLANIDGWTDGQTNGPTDGWTNRLTDRRTNKVAYRVACTQLKSVTRILALNSCLAQISENLLDSPGSGRNLVVYAILSVS